MTTGKTKFFPFNYWHYRHVSYSILDDSVICSNESIGTTEYTLGSARPGAFLPGVEVSRTVPGR